MYETIKSWYYGLFGDPVPVRKQRKLLSRGEIVEIEAKLLNIPGQPSYSQVELAIIYGVSTSVISKIHRGEHRFSANKTGGDTEEHSDV